MAINCEEALVLAVKHLSSDMKDRLKIVDHVSGCLYGIGNIDFNNSWIIYVPSEGLRVDGPEQYILVNKKTGIITEKTTTTS
jgi:hypothetical protein